MKKQAPLSTADLELLGELLRASAGVEGNTDAALSQLCARSCAIVPASPGGHRLLHSGLEVWQDYLEHVLKRDGWPRQVRVYRRAGSTQDHARQAREPIAVLADEQTAGRGRLGRQWIAPPGTAVLLSMTHRLADSADESIDLIQCIAAVAVAQALERLSGRRTIQIKWPNDLMVDGRKLAGILVETFDAGAGQRAAVIGVGINVAHRQEDLAAFPEELRRRVVSLHELGCQADRLHVAERVIVHLDQLLRTPYRKVLLDEWRSRNLMRDQRAVFQCDGRRIAGEVVDLDYRDGLIVRTDEGELVHLHAATTTVLES
jgi:BirA family biotin operon repressor/biotin-[acetyl-CoA-carboxylase] ligase